MRAATRQNPIRSPFIIRLSFWLAAASTLLYVCSRFVPSSPPIFYGEIEDSFIQYLHVAFLQHVQFGREFIFNFGPWGFLYGGYYPATHSLAVAAWLGFAVVFWWAGWLAAGHFSGNRFAAWLWLMAFAAIAGLPIFTFIEARFKALVALLWLLHFFVGNEDPSPLASRLSSLVTRHSSAAAQAALVIALALASLIKFNVLVDTVAILGVIALDDIFRRRRFPWLLPLFAAALVVFWVAARQPLSGLVPFLRTVPLLTNGYTEAVMLTGPDALWDVGCFLLGAAMVWALAAYANWALYCSRSPRKAPEDCAQSKTLARSPAQQTRSVLDCGSLLSLFRPRAGGFALLGLAFLLFTAFKHGNVRHDFHQAAATLDLSLLALAALAAAWPLRNTRPLTLPTLFNAFNPITWACLLPPTVVFLFTAAVFSRYFDPGLPAHLLGTFSMRSLSAPAKPLFDRGYLQAGYESYLAGIRENAPLPPIKGTVDTYPGNASAPLAWGCDYHPRPIMQSLVAYTPGLQELNAAFLRGGLPGRDASPRRPSWVSSGRLGEASLPDKQERTQAPANILFQLAPIDDHFPAMEDGRSWPELLTRYDVAEVQWSFVLLKRAVAPRPWRLEPFADLPLRFGEIVSLPAMTNGSGASALWATLEINKTLLGSMASALYKPPTLWLSIFTHDGACVRYRVAPGMAASGFVLSPVIQNPMGFAELARGGHLPDLADKQVDSVCLTAETGSGSTACYGSPMRLRLYRLDFPSQDLDKVAGFRELKSLWNTSARAHALYGDYPPSWTYLRECGSVLRVAPNSAIRVALDGHPKRLKLGFGILDSASTLQGAGVVFRASTIGPQGDLVPLWSRRLAAPSSGAGPTREQAMIDLGTTPPSELVLATQSESPPQPAGVTCYWSVIEPQ